MINSNMNNNNYGIFDKNMTDTHTKGKKIAAN